jgi:two-component system, NtrC family, nitrogen regulation response regulator GlnG
MPAGSILVADDDAAIRTVLNQALSRAGYEVRSTSNAATLWRWVSQGEGDLVITDVVMPDENAFELLPRIKKMRPELPVIIMSAQNTFMTAVRASERGAYEYLPKPFDLKELIGIVGRALSEPKERTRPAPKPDDFDSIPLVGRSPAMQEIYRVLARLMQTDLTVMISGESGTGKELVANLLHRLSWRRAKPWFALNCAAIAPTLVEPTLFGYAKGAFTGATQNKSGYFEDASDGTLFLDEIGELPLELQAKLLRVLENGEFQRVGETQQRFSRARVIAATNRDLRQEVRKGNFRADLYHRLSVFSIEVPALREMDDDRALLLDHYRKFYADQAKLPPFNLDDASKKAWRAYHFPGNVRELRNVVIRLTTKYAGQKLSLSELEPEFDLEEQTDGSPGLPADSGTLVDQAQRHLQRERTFNLDQMLKAWEQGYIEAAMKLTRGNVSQAAKMLGINRTTLYSRMESAQKQQ